jgi:ankyrin repeat protein
LVQATVAVDAARVRQLLESGADPNKVGPYEGHYQSPWMLALHQARQGRPDTIAIVQAMLKAGANPEAAWGEWSSRSGGYRASRNPPILEALSNSAPDVARALMQAGFNPHQKLARVALELAVENGEADIVHVLVESGVDVNRRTSGTTPLVAAIEKRNVALMTYLEEHGAREKP